MTGIDPRSLRDAFGTFLTGVTVVTTLDNAGGPVGFTANSFTSVSLDPPLVLICIAKTSGNYDTFLRSTGFAVNVLSDAQKDVSNTFARPVEDRFATVSWTPGPNGAPVLDDVSAWFDCATHQTVDAGDHLILIGKVEAFASSTQPGLGYARGAYVTPAVEAEAMTTRKDILVSALIEYRGKILLVDDGHGHVTLPEARVGRDGVTHVLQQLIATTGTTAAPGFVYSVYEDEARQTQHFSFLCQAEDQASRQGVFTELTEATLTDISDPAMCAMLERFAEECRMGNFGVYLGSEISGKVRPVAKRD